MAAKPDCERSLKVQHRSGLRFVCKGQVALVIDHSALPRLFFDAAVHERQFRNHQHFQSGIGQDTILGSHRPGIELDLAMAFWTRLTFYILSRFGEIEVSVSVNKKPFTVENRIEFEFEFIREQDETVPMTFRRVSPERDDTSVSSMAIGPQPMSSTVRGAESVFARMISRRL